MKTLSVNNEIKTLAVADKDYPANLRYIFDPPETLYLKGQIIPEDSIAIAIVGSRRATYYGLKNAEDLGFALAARGITVISGLARGVDSAAHRGALKAGGRTIAVLGSGLNVIYPAENKALAQEIARSGAVISEFTPDTGPTRYNFPRRNRIISGLSLGVVVVEAARKSGALITADFALEQGRDVFALPGKIDSFTSGGTHGLIKEGAKLTESIEDIVEELEALRSYQDLTGTGVDRAVKNGEKAGLKLSLPEEERRVYAALSLEPVHIDEMMQNLKFSCGRLLTSLLKLEHKKLIKELPGKLYVRK